MAAALRTSVATGQIKSNTALNTEEFVEMLNKTFDCLNSRYQFTKSLYSCAISQKTPIVTSTLKDTQVVMEKLKKINAATNKISRPPCFDSLITTINAVLWLYDNQHG